MSVLANGSVQTHSRKVVASGVLDVLKKLPGEAMIEDDAVVSMGRFKLTSHESEIPASEDCTIVLSQECSGALVADYDGKRTETTVKPGMITLAPAEVNQRYEFKGHAINTIMSIKRSFFTKVEEIEPALGSYSSMDAIVHWTRPKLGKLIEDHHRLLTSGDIGWRVLSESLSLQIAYEILTAFSGRNAKKTGTLVLTPSEISRLTDFIDAEMENNINLSSLAMELDREPFGFSRSFKATTGESPHQYVIQRRLMKAKDMLANTNAQLAEIAYACGFSNQPHMTSVFSKCYCISPGKWRKLNQS